MALAIGMDLGGTNARAAAVDDRGRLVRVAKRAHAGGTPEQIADALAACVDEVRAGLGSEASSIDRYGLGVAGQVDSRTGRILVAPQLHWRDVNLRVPLEARLGAPVLLANDLAAAALGEARCGAARGHEDAILVFVGSGVGSGLILGGRIHRGVRGFAGEFGHTKVRPGGRLCNCGERGCLEAYAGGHQLSSRAAEAMAEGRATILQVPAGLRPTPAMLDAAAAKGDALSIELLDDAAELVGVASANLVTELNPAVLVFGGGVLNGSKRMREGIEAALRVNAGRGALSDLLVVDAVLGDDAGVIGAASLARGE